MSTSISIWSQKQIILILTYLNYHIEITTFELTIKNNTVFKCWVHALKRLVFILFFLFNS